MSSKSITSFSPKSQNLSFLNTFPQKYKMNKSELINTAFDMYRKYCLRKEMREGFAQQTDEDVKLAMSDFQDYQSLIEEK